MSPVPIERPSAARRARQTLTRLALLLSAGGCLDDAPVAAGDPTVRAILSANVVGAAAGGIVRIRVGYRTSRQGFVALPSSPQQVAVPAASTVVLPLTVDISPCLADAERATSETAGCALVIELTLTDAAGETLDSQVRDARDPVLPGQSVNFGSVTVGVTVSGIIVTPSSVSMIVSQQQSLSATVRDASGAAVTTVPVVWNSSDATVAQLVPATSTTITIRALKLGTATVTASAGGKTSNSTAVNVVPPTPLTVRQRQGAGCVIVGQTITMEVDSPPGAVTWTSGNPSIASVGATTGIATGVAAGEVAVTASSGGRTGVATLCVTGPLTVLPASLSLTAARTGQIVASGVTG